MTATFDDFSDGEMRSCRKACQRTILRAWRRSISGVELTLIQAQTVGQALALMMGWQASSLGTRSTSARSGRRTSWSGIRGLPDEAIIIAELLKNNTNVLRLDLARNQIGDPGAVALANMLASNSSLSTSTSSPTCLANVGDRVSTYCNETAPSIT